MRKWRFVGILVLFSSKSMAQSAAAISTSPTPNGDAMLAPPPPAHRVVQSWHDAMTLVRQNSTTLRQLAARTEAARAGSRQALAKALPSLIGNAGVSHHLLRGERSAAEAALVGPGYLPNSSTLWTASVALRVPVLNVDAWQSRSTARAVVEQTRLESSAAERTSVADASDAIVAVMTAERLAEVGRVALNGALTALELQRRKAEFGAANSLDLLRIEQEVALSRDQVIGADDDVLRAREALGAALGAEEPYGLAPSLTLDALLGNARESCRAGTDIAGRADVQAALESLNVAEHREHAVTSSYWPTLDAVSSLGYWSDTTTTVNNEHVTWTVGGMLQWTLYDGGFRYGARDERRAEVKAAREDVRAARREAGFDVVGTRRALQKSQARLQVAARTRDVTAEMARLARLAYAAGTGTSFDLVDTARRQREAELDYTIKEFAVVRARLAAVFALANCHV
jgi:outer membrane protein TolC